MMCVRKKDKQKTYHSELKDETLNTPQWMKMPTLLASYHAGNGRASNESQSGVYFCPVADRRKHETTAAITRVIKESISIFDYLQNSASELHTIDGTWQFGIFHLLCAKKSINLIPITKNLL